MCDEYGRSSLLTHCTYIRVAPSYPLVTAVLPRVPSPSWYRSMSVLFKKAPEPEEVVTSHEWMRGDLYICAVCQTREDHMHYEQSCSGLGKRIGILCPENNRKFVRETGNNKWANCFPGTFSGHIIRAHFPQGTFSGHMQNSSYSHAEPTVVQTVFLCPTAFEGDF
jgi:hypothetical protein